MFRPVDDGGILVDMRSGACFELNRTGVEIWNLLVAGATLGSMCEMLTTRYGLSREDAARDVGQLIDALDAQRLVALSGSGSS